MARLQGQARWLLSRLLACSSASPAGAQVSALEKEINFARQTGFATANTARRLQVSPHLKWHKLACLGPPARISDAQRAQMELDLAHARAQNAEDASAQLHALLQAALQQARVSLLPATSTVQLLSCECVQLTGNARAATCGPAPETASLHPSDTELSFLSIEQVQHCRSPHLYGACCTLCAMAACLTHAGLQEPDFACLSDKEMLDVCADLFLS